MQNKQNIKNEKAINILTKKAEDLIERHPSLNTFKYEIDELLWNSSCEQNRQNILDIMYRSKIEEINSKIKYLHKLFDSLVIES